MKKETRRLLFAAVYVVGYAFLLSVNWKAEVGVGVILFAYTIQNSE